MQKFKKIINKFHHAHLCVCGSTRRGYKILTQAKHSSCFYFIFVGFWRLNKVMHKLAPAWRRGLHPQISCTRSGNIACVVAWPTSSNFMCSWWQFYPCGGALNSYTHGMACILKYHAPAVATLPMRWHDLHPQILCAHSGNFAHPMVL